MRNPVLWVVVLSMSLSVLAEESALIDGMEDANLRKIPTDKGQTVESVDGKFGKAIKFGFPENCSGLFIDSKIRGKPEWDSADGFSFWVKGDGSDKLGGIQFIWNEDYALRYTVAFPIDGTEWKKVTIAWRDVIPALPNANAKPLDAKTGNAPSKISSCWIGKFYFWKEYGAHSFALDEWRLEPKIDLDSNEYKPAAAPLARVMEKLKAKKPITIVTVGDSLTDFAHWANKQTNWPTLLKAKIKEKYGSEVTLVNPAIGGTLLRQGMIIIPRWVKQAPEPDLVTICYGYNDKDSGMTGDQFFEAQKDAIERVRRATHGKADVLIITTCPAATKWDGLEDMANACRKAAKEKNAGICDTAVVFHEAGKENKDRLYADGTHMSAIGHELLSKTVLDAIETNAK
jgi:lysophospholipase L1-like esterase